MSDRYMNAMACGIEPEREGEEPTLAQWRDRCRQLYRENIQLRKSPFAAAGPGMVTSDPAPHAARAPVITGQVWPAKS